MEIKLVCDCGEELAFAENEAVECGNCGKRYRLVRKVKDTVEA